MSTWIGLDSGLAAFGYAVLRREETSAVPTVVEMGTFRTRPDPTAGKLADRADRVRSLGESLLALMGRLGVQDAYIESLALGMQTGRGTVQTLGRVRGLVEGICLAKSVRLAEVRPEALKLAVTGRKDASKEHVARMLQQIYFARAADVWERSLDATDALAVAHVGAHRAGGAAWAGKMSSGVVDYRDPAADAGFLDF